MTKGNGHSTKKTTDLSFLVNPHVLCPIMTISEPVPEDFTMTFKHRNKDVGTITVNKDLKMEFSGHLERSAIIFMKFIKPHIEEWLEKKWQKKT